MFYYIAGHCRGWSFSPKDLLHKYTRQEIDSTLIELVKKNKIRRIARG
ncbi:hypothetical protein QIW31_07650 [Francisellaceae bacterium CB299]